ncbi:MAG: TlpA disulfide reductase family protein [Pseudomonadota bacterium]
MDRNTLGVLLGSFLRPRVLLHFWGGLGVILLAYIIIASSIQTGDKPGPDAVAREEVGPIQDPNLLVGSISKFTYAFMPRSAPPAVFDIDAGPGEKIGAEKLKNEGRRLSDYRGKTILVNFWATWCAPCKKELPTLDALQRDLGGEAFEVVTVAADRKGRKAAQATFDELGIKNLDVFMDQRLSLVIAVGGDSALPLTILYDPAGNEVGRLVGEADWNSPEARALIERVIAAG